MNVKEAIRNIINDPVLRKDIRLATVLSVSGSICNVRALDTDAEIDDVRLQPEESDGILMTPAVGSTVAIAPIADFEFIVVMFSELDTIKMLDGSFGGLTKTQELKTQLDKTNEVLQAVVDSLKNWVVVPSDGGAALKTFFNTTLGVKVKGDFTNIENEKITHGTV
jgi:hypothetical protein